MSPTLQRHTRVHVANAYPPMKRAGIPEIVRIDPFNVGATDKKISSKITSYVGNHTTRTRWHRKISQRPNGHNYFATLKNVIVQCLFSLFFEIQRSLFAFNSLFHNAVAVNYMLVRSFFHLPILSNPADHCVSAFIMP